MFMNNALLIMLSLIGLLALYWVLFGQWKYNKIIAASNFSEELQSKKEVMLDGKKR